MGGLEATRSKKGFVAVWLRHAPAPLLWIHPIAKNRVLMPDGDSNAIFYSRGIFIVGTCPPMKMVGKSAFSAVCVPPLRGGTFFIPRENTAPVPLPPAAPGGSNTAWFRFRGRCRAQQCPAHADPLRVSGRAPSPRGPGAKLPRPRPRSCRTTAPTKHGRPAGPRPPWGLFRGAQARTPKTDTARRQYSRSKNPAAARR